MLHDILVNYLLPLLIYGFITGLANLALAHKSQIETWSESHPKYAGFLKLMRAVGFDPWSLVAALSLWAKKRLPDAQQNGAKAIAQLKAASVRPLPLEEHEPTPRWAGPSSGSGLAVLLLVALASLHSSACNLFGANGSFWPAVKSCAPSPSSLVSQAADVLLAGGDYEAALKELALKDGADAVLCAVRAAVDQLMGKVGANPENGAAAARGKAFLAKHEVAP